MEDNILEFSKEFLDTNIRDLIKYEAKKIEEKFPKLKIKVNFQNKPPIYATEYRTTINNEPEKIQIIINVVTTDEKGLHHKNDRALKLFIFDTKLETYEQFIIDKDNKKHTIKDEKLFIKEINELEKKLKKELESKIIPLHKQAA